MSPTLLVVDDEKWARDPVVELLRRAGYEILTASDGPDAVALCQAHATEIVAVLLDHHVPRGGGEEIFEQIQHISPNTPVIMTSAAADHEVIGHFLGMGVVGFLRKPFGRTTLLDAVREALTHFEIN